MKIKITKLEKLPDARQPNNISVGFEKVFENNGKINPPVLGERFYPGNNRYWSTSGVIEIIDENTFKTYSSIYKWEIVEDEL